MATQHERDRLAVPASFSAMVIFILYNFYLIILNVIVKVRKTQKRVEFDFLKKNIRFKFKNFIKVLESDSFQITIPGKHLVSKLLSNNGN